MNEIINQTNGHNNNENKELLEIFNQIIFHSWHHSINTPHINWWVNANHSKIGTPHHFTITNSRNHAGMLHKNILQLLQIFEAYLLKNPCVQYGRI